MRYLLIILFSIFSVSAWSQGPPITTTKATVTRQLTIPNDTLTMVLKDSGSLAFKGDTLYRSKPNGVTVCKWVPVGYISFSKNIGAGYRLVIPNTDNVKTVFPLYGLTIDSSTNTNALSFKLDTATVFPAIRSTIAGGSTPSLNQVLSVDSVSNHGIYLSATTTVSTLNAYFFGDSETAGYGLPSPTTQAWPVIVSNRLGLTATNNAVSGWTLQTIGGFGTGSMQANLAIIPTKGSNDKLIFFAFGVNDHRWMNGGFDTASFRAVYNTVITNATSKGWLPAQIVLVSPFYVQNKTYYNDSATYSFAQAATQLRNQQFGAVVQSLSLQRGTKFVNGYSAVLNSGGDKLIQYDSLHLDKFGDVAVANEATIVVDTVKQAGNKLAVNGVTELNKIRLKTPVNNGLYLLGQTLDGFLGLVSELQANNASITNDVTIGGTYRGGQVFLSGKALQLPNTGNYATFGYDESGQYAILGTSPALGSSGTQYIQLNGGKTILGGAGNTANGAKLQVNGGSYLGPTLFDDIGTLPTGTGAAIFRIGGATYMYNTDASPFYLGYTNTPVILSSSANDGVHKIQVRGNAKFFEPVSIGPGQNSRVDVRLVLDSGTLQTVPLMFTPHAVKRNSALDGAMEFDSTYYYLSAIGVRDTISTRAWARSVFGTAGATNLSYTQNALNNIVNSSTGTGATLLTATSSLAGLLDTARAKFIDSARGRLIVDSTPFPLTATYIAYGNASNQLTGKSAFAFDGTNNLFTNAGKSKLLDTLFVGKTIVDSANFRIVGDIISYQSGSITTSTGFSYTTGGINALGRNATSGRYEEMPNSIITSSASTLTLGYGGDYFFNGTTATYTLPAISAQFVGRKFSIIVKNIGSGAVTINSASGSTIYDTAPVATYNLAAGVSVTFISNGTYLTVN